MFLEISQNLQENTCARISFLVQRQLHPNGREDAMDIHPVYAAIVGNLIGILWGAKASVLASWIAFILDTPIQ